MHIDALTLIETLHVLALCRLAVQLAHRRCPPPLPKDAGGRPRTYCEESLLLIALLKTLWRLSYQDVHEWLQSWPALALACGLPLDWVEILAYKLQPVSLTHPANQRLFLSQVPF